MNKPLQSAETYRNMVKCCVDATDDAYMLSRMAGFVNSMYRRYCAMVLDEENEEMEKVS